MKSMKKYLLILLALTLILCFASCGGKTPDGNDEACKTCVDENGDEKCDVCGKEVVTEEQINDITLIENKEAKFQFVLAKDLEPEVRRSVNIGIKTTLKNTHKIDINVVAEGGPDDTESEIEILIGDVTSRGEKYIFDRHTLGKEGYIIKIVGSKILINAGSDETLIEVIEDFANDVLKIGEKNISDVIMTTNDAKHKVQDGYKITALKVNGTDMKNYTIAADITRDFYKDAALDLQEIFYDRTGYWFNIVDLESATDKSIVMKHVDKSTVGADKSYSISVNGSTLVIECAYDNMLEKATAKFAAQKITLARGEIDFNGDIYKQDISTVYYEDFGAKGDGKTDDFKAIYDAHTFANISGQTVKAKPGAEYYIFETRIDPEAPKVPKTVLIQTNVDWQGASFIIDDSKMSYLDGNPNTGMNANIFKVVPNNEHAVITIRNNEFATNDHREFVAKILANGLNPSTTKIDIKLDGWDGDLMLIPYNSSHTVYRRKGYGAYEGKEMHEVIVIDKDGNVSPETPIMFDYTDITYVEVYRLDESSAITIENGKFTTIACAENAIRYGENGEASTVSAYIARNINVVRSYTTVKNVEHYMTGEIPLYEQVNDKSQIVKVGYCYNGFFLASNANHVTFENCVLTGKRAYRRPQGGTGGTYDLSANCVNKIVFRGCTQSNFWVTVDDDYNIHPATKDTPGALTSMASVSLGGFGLQMHWGVGGTNFCKNMEYIDSTLSRFDAHEGLYNGKIINSTINYMELIGNGDFIMEDVTWYQSSSGVGFIALRADYGWTWDGDISVKNLNAYIFHSPGNTQLIYHGYTNWYFGYTTAFPNISLHNADFYNIADNKPIEDGYEIQLTKSVSQTNARMHLADSGLTPYLAVTDRDNDGFIDEPAFDVNLDGKVDPPIDLDGNGIAGNSSVLYKDNIGNDSGVALPNTTVNLNRVRPPQYIKITGNDGVDGEGGYVYIVSDTSGQDISDGMYWFETDSLDGFFGGTKFIWGDGEDEYCIGTDPSNNSRTETFEFR